MIIYKAILAAFQGRFSTLQVAVFVDALLKVHEGKKNQVDPVTNEKKSQLFGEEETPIKLQISGIKLPKEGRKHLIKM